MSVTYPAELSQDIFEILYKSNLGVAICDGEGRFIWANPQYEKISQFEMRELAGQNILDIQNARSVHVLGAKSMLSVVLRECASYTSMVDFKTGHDVIATATPVFNADGSLRWLMYSLTDCDQVFQLQQKLTEMTERVEASQLQLQEALLGKHAGCLTHDKGMLDIYATALRLAHVSATLLILGETGTGKDHMAKFIHNSSTRKDCPFVHVNCSAIPENLFESELFGYESGSFTGSSKKGKMGLIEYANSGTLYLDEVAELPLNLQTKLLTVLQNKTVTRIGAVTSRPVDVRVVAATNMDMQQLVQEKKFREDLYYRLNVLQIRLPPLRKRKDDIVPFIHHFTEQFNSHYAQQKQFSQQALQVLTAYQWPGNVRELEHLVERLVIMSLDDFIGVSHLPEELKNTTSVRPYLESGKTLREILNDVEEQVLRATISATPCLHDAAKVLGIELSTLTRKKQKYNIYQNK